MYGKFSENGMAAENPDGTNPLELGTQMRSQIRAEIATIDPLDALERQHIADSLNWIDSGADLFRLVKPATPPMHLVSYFAVVDSDHILLVNHKDARLWLPTGGHVEPREHPRNTVVRELQEELGLTAAHAIESPIMVTCRITGGISAGHTDVSLWYVVYADRMQTLKYDTEEFNAVCWFQFAEVPLNQSDPHLDRFIKKLRMLPVSA